MLSSCTSGHRVSEVFDSAAICRPKILSVVIVEHLSDVHRMVYCAVQQTRDSLLNITLKGTFVTIQ